LTGFSIQIDELLLHNAQSWLKSLKQPTVLACQSPCWSLIWTASHKASAAISGSSRMLIVSMLAIFNQQIILFQFSNIKCGHTSGDTSDEHPNKSGHRPPDTFLTTSASSGHIRMHTSRQSPETLERKTSWCSTCSRKKRCSGFCDEKQ